MRRRQGCVLRGLRRVGATAGAHPSRLLTAHTVAIGIARGEYSSHSTSIRLMYLSHMTRYTAIRHQPVKPASPTLNQNMESCLPVLLGSYEAATTSGSLMYQATATATAIHNIADSFLKASGVPPQKDATLITRLTLPWKVSIYVT